MLAMTSRGRVAVPGWPRETHQAGDALRGIPTEMGADVHLDDDGLTVTGGDTITGLDADRLTALAVELRGLGAAVDEHHDGLSIAPAPLHGGQFKTYADHRMAH